MISHADIDMGKSTSRRNTNFQTIRIMAIDDCKYRTRTYIAGDWTGDFDLINQLHEWNDNNHLNLNFVDVHELTQSSDNTLNCNIKKSLRKRLNITKTFVLIVGEHTSAVTSGACFICKYYRKWHTIPPSCIKDYSIDNRSYIQYECEMALKDYKSGRLRNIVVIYNGLINPIKDRCPELLKDVGIHIGSDSRNDKGELCWNYAEIKDAILGK